jgi:hypothetical integral membrane protein (TIGR02206 family)
LSPLEETTFPRFGLEHDLALVVVAGATAAAIVFARRASPRAATVARFVMAALMLGGSLTEIVVGLWTGLETADDLIPLQLCDFSLFLGAYTLVTLSEWTIEPLFYFAMSGTVAALVTPELPCVHVADFRFLAYFGLHGLTIMSALVLPLGLGLVPARGAWWRAVVWINGYAAVVALFNLAAGTNLLYLRSKPTVPTLFDVLGPWPWYLVSLEGVCLALFFVLDVGLRVATRSRPGVSVTEVR